MYFLETMQILYYVLRNKKKKKSYNNISKMQIKVRNMS